MKEGRTIWKSGLPWRTGVHTIKLPPYAKFLSAGLDPSGDLSVWAEVYLVPGAKYIDYSVWLVFTGAYDTYPGRAKFLDTVVANGLVWHVFVSGGRA